ncbi:hypothetical protein L0128_03130 [candidate division KSB1 bacterium]|nr:hypothetical protein [candidate division KSB1 bacterium]
MGLLFRNKCDFCHCYCIFEYTIYDKKVSIKCTHCQDEVYYSRKNHKKIKNRIKQAEAVVKAIERYYPDLQNLKFSGDFAKPPFKTFQPGDAKDQEVSMLEE